MTSDNVIKAILLINPNAKVSVGNDSLDQITFPDPKSFMPMEVLKIYDSIF